MNFYKLENKRGSSSPGRATASQAVGSGFESRLPLLFSFKAAHKMKNFLLVLGCLLILSALVNDPPGDDETFQRLYALEGRWIMKTSKGFIGEEWIKVNDQYLQNRGFIVRESDTIITERVALTNTNNGIFYTSTVEDQNNKQPVPFKLSSGKEKVFVFENAKHDFPKRIVYEIVSSDSLHAYIDDGKNDTKNRQDFYYKKF